MVQLQVLVIEMSVIVTVIYAMSNYSITYHWCYQEGLL